ncbi:MAG TPA: bifunctional riboflavin kinase/FAD synthetase [Candidatus Acidoferrales bacterium]|nr:bifunctional riboflavin kinase/FAD synthetase [Candidatus Acidoferrales bacterium]
MAFRVFNSAEEWAAHFGGASRSTVTVGNFDGLHVGHQKILRSVRERAQATGERAAVITFDPHPMRVLHPERAPVMIQTLAQRLAGFEELGLDAALVLRFDRALSLMSAENFIDEILAGALRAGAILVGANFRFGHRGAGDVHMLVEHGKTRGFSVEIVPPVEVDGRVVSSTAIRAAVAGGDVEGAIPLLGRAFSLTGEIRGGAGRGRTILFPTLNLEAEQELLPKLGVYATECLVSGKLYSSVTNVGTRPTFNGSGVTVESHLFGFSENLTDGRMEVRFHSRIRDERKFSGADELRAQIARDIDAARKFFSERALAGNYSRK